METPAAFSNEVLDLLARVRRSFLDDSLNANRLVSVAARPYDEVVRGRFFAHLHVGVEVGIILNGMTERFYEDYHCQAGRGDVWLCGMWEPHGWWVQGEGASRVIVNFLPEYLGEERLGRWHWWALFAAPPSQRPRVTDPVLRERVLAIAEEMAPEIQELGPGWQEAVRLSMLKLLFLLSRDWSPPFREGKRRSGNDLGRLLPVLALLRDYEGAGPTLLEAAAACNLQRSQFSLLFRRTMGASFGRFRLRLRLARAGELLLETEQPVEEIATRVGFSDGSHLHRAFVQQYGCTPGAYRERAL